MIFLNNRYSIMYAFNFVRQKFYLKIICSHGTIITVVFCQKYVTNVFLIRPKQIFHFTPNNVW